MRAVLRDLSVFTTERRSQSQAVWVVIKACLDGSGHGDTKSRFITLAGFVGVPEAWTDFETRWEEVLTQHGAPYLHMVEAMHYGGAFARRKGWTAQKVDVLVKDVFNRCLVKVPRDAFVGFSCTVDLGAYQLVKAERHHLKSPQALCAERCVDLALKIARILREGNLLTGSVELFFDRHEPYEPLARLAWNRRNPVPWWSEAVATMAEADWRLVTGLQAADLSAWAFNRHYTKQDQEWLTLGVQIMKAQFHHLYDEPALRTLP